MSGELRDRSHDRRKSFPKQCGCSVGWSPSEFRGDAEFLDAPLTNPKISVYQGFLVPRFCCAGRAAQALIGATPSQTILELAAQLIDGRRVHPRPTCLPYDAEIDEGEKGEFQD